MKRPITATLFAVLIAGLATTAADAARKKLQTSQHFPADEGTRVVVDASAINIHLRSSDVREVEVSADLRISGVSEDKAEDWISRHTPEVNDGEGELRVSANPGRGGFLGLGLLTARARLSLVTPGWVIPDLTTTDGDIRVRGDFPRAAPLRMRTATGGMEFTGATAELEVHTASGDTRIDLIRPLERLFARTSSGDVTLTGGARDVQVDTASGDVRLGNLSGSAVVETSTGGITLEFDRFDAGSRVKVRTASGRVHIVIPEGAAPRGAITTTAGTIRCDLEGSINERGDSLQLEGDGALLSVDTASGAIIIEVAD